MKFILVFVLFCFAACAQAQFVNGTFQDDFSYDCTAGPAWVTSTGNGLEPERTDIFYFGNAWVDMTPCGNWGNGTWIEQSVPTVVNQCYSVTFDLGSYCGWDGSDAGIYVSIDGVQLGDRIFNNVFSCVSGTLGWATFTSPVFVATNTSTTIRFTGEGRCSEISPIDGNYMCTPVGSIGNPGVIGFDNVVLNSLGASVSNVTSEEGICPGESITIGESTTGVTYLWSTGETTATISVDEPGIYTFDFVGSCSSGTGTINVIGQELPELISLGPDTLVCPPFFFAITEQNAPVNWSTGETDISITVSEPDTYWAMSQTVCGTVVDTITLLSPNESIFTLEELYTVCDGDSLKIIVPENIQGIQWSNGSTNREVAFGASGAYQLQYSNSCNEFVEDFSLEVEDCSCHIYIPNCFTANDDGINDVWKPYLDDKCAYKLEVWNRWGDLVFSTTSNEKLWTGNTHDGSHFVPDGIYAYRLEYVTNKVERKELTGHVVMLR